MRTGLRLRQFGSLPSASLLLGRRSPVRSIQRGTIAASIAGGTATITSVDPNHALLRWLGVSTNQAELARQFVLFAFTNATTITATRGADSGTTTGSFEVIEYWPGVIRSIQRGTIAMAAAAASNTATITAVQSLTKTTLDFLGVTNDENAAASAEHAQTRLVLTNTTTVTATRAGGLTGAVVVGYQVVEWF